MIGLSSVGDTNTPVPLSEQSLLTPDRSLLFLISTHNSERDLSKDSAGGKRPFKKGRLVQIELADGTGEPLSKRSPADAGLRVVEVVGVEHDL